MMRSICFKILHITVMCVVMAKSEWPKISCLPCVCGTDRHNESIIMNCTNKNLTGDRHLPLPPPQATSKTTTIYFDNNTISSLNDMVLSGYKKYQISFLSFRNNDITNISKYAFSDMMHLHGLDLSENQIDEEVLKASFQGMPKTLKTLNISAMGLRNISTKFFQPFENRRNFSLSFHNNTDNYFPMEQFMSLKYLEELDFGSNRLKKLDVQHAEFPILKNLTLDNNVFYGFPDFCLGNDRNTRFPQLQLLSIQWNSMRYLDTGHYRCLTSLKHFYLNGNLFAELISNQFAMLPNLFKITLSYVGCAMNKVEPAVFNNSALQQIFFRENHIWFRKEEVSLRIFEGCSNLKLLNLNDNVFQVTTEDEFRTLLQSLTTLKILVMGGCALSFIPKVITENLTNLESLALYRNSISELGKHAFDNLKNLKKLFLGNNKLTVIGETALPKDFISNATDVEFIGNPFSCTCDLMWFINWMTTHKGYVFKLIQNNYSHLYTCASPDNLKGHYLLDLDMSEASCLLDQGEKVLTLTLSILLIVFLFVGSGLYRYRWHIRYFIYMIRYSQRQEVENDHYEYDAFVAYSSEDRGWVIKTLLPVIEDKENLKLCVHDRDFEVGNLIVDNIVDGIEKSRKVMIILSNNFAKSDWCQFELNLIQRHVLENGQRLLVLVMLEEIETRHVTKAMRVMLQMTTYLLWGEEDYARKAFFNRLRLMLQKPSRRGKERRLSV